MEAVRTWAFSVCASMVACGIALQLMPKSNLTGMFKLVVSVFFLCCLLSPVLIRIPEGRLWLPEYSAEIAEEKAARLQEVMEKQTRINAEQAAQKIIADKLRQMGINYHSIAININTNGQSETGAVVTILLDKSLEPEHWALKRQIEQSLEMNVNLGYTEEEWQYGGD